MAKLTEPMKIFIVQSLACFETPQQVADAVKNKFNVDVDRMQCAGYDPTKITGEKMARKLKDLFYKTRDDFKANVYGIPLANKAVRLNELQKMYDDWGKNKIMKQNIIKQVKDEMQGHDSQLLDIELKKLEIQQKLEEAHSGTGSPTPVSVTISVVDASKTNDQHQSNAECATGEIPSDAE